MKENEKGLSDIVKEFAKKNSSEARSYNIFTEWRMNENDHTKLLLALLRYTDGTGYYPLLYSFFVRFAKGNGKMIHYKRPSDIKIQFNKDRIDGLITFSVHEKPFSIILENKIFGAVDQPNQIRNYIKKRNEVDQAHNNIWVFYITSDGDKEIDRKRSYNPDGDTEKINIGKRFVPINYRDHILPWLKSDVLKPRIYPEFLTSIVRQYVDFLESDMFCDDAIRGDQNVLLSILGIPSIIHKMSKRQVEHLYLLQKQLFEVKARLGDGYDEFDASAVTKLYCILSTILKRIESEAFDVFEKITKEILQERWDGKMRKGLLWQVAHRAVSGNNGYVQIRLVDEWGTIHMEWENVSTISMLFGGECSIALHIEDRDLKHEWMKKLNDFRLSEQFVRMGHNRGVRYNIPKTEKPLAKTGEEDLKNYLHELYVVKLDQLFALLIDHACGIHNVNK